MEKQLDYDVLIIGGYGHVGLPLGIAFADAGLQVALYDLNVEAGKTIEQGKMPFLEHDAEPVLKRVIGTSLHLVDDLSAVSRSKSIIITIGTPVDEYLNPKLLPILDLADDLKPHLHPGHHLILRSTIFPGTTQRIDEHFAQAGIRVDLSFCPERIVQGYAIRELGHLPQIVSGLTPAAVEKSRQLFDRLGVSSIDVSVIDAELTKLFSNAYRYIQFATANQFFMIAEENGADFEKIRYAMTYGYQRASEFPGAGFAAGPCLLKDTMQLSAFYKNDFMLGHAAMLVNEGLPSFVVNQLCQRHDLKNETVGILGMAFKGNVDDIRDSLSFKLAKLLRFQGAEVLCSDEFAEAPSFVSREELLARSSIVVIGAPHRQYREMSVPEGVDLVDIWNVVPIHEAMRVAA